MKTRPKGNVSVELAEDHVVVKVCTDPEKVQFEPSGTGKTITIGTTGGYVWYETAQGTIGVNITVSKKPNQ